MILSYVLRRKCSGRRYILLYISVCSGRQIWNILEIYDVAIPMNKKFITVAIPMNNSIDGAFNFLPLLACPA